VGLYVVEMCAPEMKKIFQAEKKLILAVFMQKKMLSLIALVKAYPVKILPSM
jgi:hypothetical protein